MTIHIIAETYRVAAELERGLISHFHVESCLIGEKISHTTHHAVLVAAQYMRALHWCRHFRQKDAKTPVLIISECQSHERVQVLDAGADDCVGGYCDADELAARIRAVLRRGSSQPRPRHLIGGGLEINLQRRVALRDGTELKLSRREFDLLEYLLRHQKVAVTRPMIIDNVWESGECWTNSVDVHIKHLRDKIDRPFGRKSIQTVQGIGYRFEPDL
jgi:two-component system OmpR family response regulator